MRAYATADGRVLWDYDMVKPFVTVNEVKANGGSLLGSDARGRDALRGLGLRLVRWTAGQCVGRVRSAPLVQLPPGSVGLSLVLRIRAAGSTHADQIAKGNTTHRRMGMTHLHYLPLNG
jgi:hypothetical protein